MHLRAAYAHLRRRSNAAFEPFGMTSDQYVLLKVLAEKGRATQQELVRYSYSDTATVGTMLRLLEGKRLVTRAPHPQDGRARSVTLTRWGSRLAEEMRQSSAGIRAELAGLFDEHEQQTVMVWLERITQAMRPPGRRRAVSRTRSRLPRCR
jgi:DNA-binding MarR family transcriptional regulator